MPFIRPRKVHELEKPTSERKLLKRGLQVDFNSISEITRDDLVSVQALRWFHNKHIDNADVATALFYKARIIYAKIKELRSSGAQISLEQAQILREIESEIRALFERELSRKDVLDRVMVSTPHLVRFIYRTQIKSAQQIISKGISLGKDGHIRDVNFTIQPEDLSKAKTYFDLTHKGADAIVICEYPKATWDWLKEHHISEEAKDEGFTNLINGDYVVKSQNILGYFDRNTNKFVFNPNYGV